jgi:hypothetical protein
MQLVRQPVGHFIQETLANCLHGRNSSTASVLMGRAQ